MSYTDSTEPTYCTVEDVEETLGLSDPNNPLDIFRFSDVSQPRLDRVVKLILASEDEIDRRTRRTWRVNYVKDYVATIQTYWNDINGIRMEYYQQGGNYIQLRKDIRPWDPEQGDKLEIRSRYNQWNDITNANYDGDPQGYDGRTAYWFDYPYGKLYLRTRMFQVKPNALRISYRYGSDEPIPSGINRLCCLLTASKIITMGIYDVKLGLGGDIAGVKDSLLRSWQTEIGTLYSSFQRSGSVHSLLR